MTNGLKFTSDWLTLNFLFFLQKTYLKAYIIPLTRSNDFCSGRDKRGVLVEKGKGPWQSNDVILFFDKIYFGEEKMKPREWSNLILFFFQNCPFWADITNISTFTFGGWSFSWSTFSSQPSEGPKGFVDWVSKKSDHGCWAIKLDHEKRPSSMVWFHGPWCKPALKVGYTFGSKTKWNSKSSNPIMWEEIFWTQGLYIRIQVYEMALMCYHF